MNPDLVIFDCDGVLVDSEPIANQILVKTLAEAGYAVSLERAVEKFVGRSMASVVDLVESDLGQPLPDGFLDHLQEATFAAFRAELRPMPGVGAAIDAIEAPVCVASSGMPEKIALSLSITGLADRFGDRVFSASMVAHGKPAPDLFLLAAARMGAAPERTVVIEDSVPGIEAAHAADMKVLGFAGGGHADAAMVERLRATGVAVFDDMSRLPSLIDNL